MSIALAALWIAAIAPAGTQAQASETPPTAQTEQLLAGERYKRLAGELRCLVCQNQTLADSNAELALDLRNEVLRLMASGQTDAQIKEHLVARYGEFVLYRPTFGTRNWVLWAGPFVLLAIGAIVLWRVTRRRAGVSGQASMPPEEAERIRRMLSDDPPR